jgi:hypothetical protein
MSPPFKMFTARLLISFVTKGNGLWAEFTAINLASLKAVIRNTMFRSSIQANGIADSIYAQLMLLEMITLYRTGQG